MHKSIVALSALSILVLTTVGWMQQSTRPVVSLGEGTMTIESVVGGEAVVRIETESEESLERVQVRGPDGRQLLDFETTDIAHGLSGLVIESRETDAAALFGSYVEGDYDIRGLTRDGRHAVGKVHLSFDLPAAPRILYPAPGSAAPAAPLTILWLGDRGVAGYHLDLEQGENDGLSVNLPPGRNSFQVPPGLLARGTETRLDLAAIGANGNRTVVETVFTTAP